ncbi:uncharacterized protein L3040_001070 [Drepanopeziza brunnea f. sp. 'multigermtubi']|uniref:Gfo/Idh/MocA-like oxidoreductase N-terminal domain-containing protein n=1 Tax=Marssonina brunnea f. sp. multigermtubi (strain MB_m1) TaxID=1072389 RepID=K1WND7_MARBU|nr:uncharacterized protein MBM_07177 [Drepanopeziza brunnea f. sp. 'multigermtubi' MB_m1]EKD14456.1 hypothetical protein MBM_07177 [Drepanopeziza brunnea f. sp. 'multigermtubi' MB_m1]KAJ5054806.1 hypothetical protein L3040_001070 [Drepanopeziza brunnea f. sp. 'multigermtubi']
MNSSSTKVRVGLIGCGEVAQVVHIPTLSFLSDHFRITYLCDVSTGALEHCQGKILGRMPPKTTKNASELCSSEDVDVVFVLSSDEYHSEQAILALQHDKCVFVEKPLALNLRDMDRIRAAEGSSRGRLMVGYMRRYAPAFEAAVQEIGGIEKILYARVRDIIGPNSVFVGQSGTFPKSFDDYEERDVLDRKERATRLVHQALEVECSVPVDDSSTMMWRVLSGLGTHDISAMREALGMPQSVLGVYSGVPFWSVIFQYPGFAVSYESGLHSVPHFDAHIEVYGKDKIVRIQYDTPYVKGLPITLRVLKSVNGSLKETTVRQTYEDAYTIELKKVYEWVKLGKPVKTTIEDARLDTEILQMIMRADRGGNATPDAS